MNDSGHRAPSRARLWLRNHVLGMLAIFVAFSGTAIAAQVADDRGSVTKAAKKKKKKKAKPGPPGPQGPAGPQGPTGPQGPSGTVSGSAGGALAGTYPNPTLDVSGGPCPNGQELVNVSANAQLTCSVGVFSDGSGNIAVGPTTMPALTTGFGNVAVGSDALEPVTFGINNAAVGSNALGANAGGSGNSAFGLDALADNTSGTTNSAFGAGALSNNTADNNSAFGVNALNDNTSGINNTAVGTDALDVNTIASDNSALGRNALGANTGADNTAVGNNALLANLGGFQNTALGDDALDSNTDGDGNTAIGQGALAAATTGNTNTALGENAGDALTTGSNNIDIKNPGVAGESGTTRIGTNGTHTRAFVAGVRGVSTGVADAIPVLIDSAGQLGTTSSSRTVKRDIEPLTAVPPLMKLRPVSFRYRSGPPELHYGLIAEQVAKAMPSLAVYGEDGLPETVQYQDLPVLLLARIQQQQRQINRLMKEVRGR